MIFMITVFCILESNTLADRILSFGRSYTFSPDPYFLYDPMFPISYIVSNLKTLFPMDFFVSNRLFMFPIDDVPDICFQSNYHPQILDSKTVIESYQACSHYKILFRLL